MELLKDYVADIIHLNGVKIANHHGVSLPSATCHFRIPTLLTYPLSIVRRTHLSLGVSYLGVQMRLHGCITADHVPALLLCPRLNRLFAIRNRERERETVCYPPVAGPLCTYARTSVVRPCSHLGALWKLSVNQSSRPEGRLILHSIRARVRRVD